MPTIKFKNPALDAGKVTQLKTQLKAAEHELALREDTGRDLVKQFSWEKDLRKEVEKKCAYLQQEQFKLHTEHTACVLAAARAEQANEGLQAQLQDLQEELFNVEVARDSSWEDYRQALIDNNRLTQEVESLKARVAGMQKAQCMTPAQQNTQSTLKFAFAMPFDRINTGSPIMSSAQVKRASFAGLRRSPLSNISNTQVLYDRARLAGLGRSPLGKISNIQGMGRLQANRTTPPPSPQLGLSTSPCRPPPSALLSKGSPKPTSSELNPAIKFSLRTEVPPPTSDAAQPPIVGTHSLWARSPSIDSQTYQKMFRPSSSCGSDNEEHAASMTPRPSWLVQPKPAKAKAAEVTYLSYACTHGSCSCLSSLDSAESSPEASQGPQSAWSSTPTAPPSGNPKYVSRQEVLEEHWGYGRSSCNDSGSDVSAASGCTSCSGATWSPAATATSPAQSTESPDSNTLHLDTGVSYGELEFEAHRLLLDTDSPLLGGDSPEPTSTELGPAINFPVLTEAVHTTVVVPKADLLLPTPTSAATGLFAPPAVGTHSLWAQSPSIDSQTYREMFRPASSCGSDSEVHAPLLTPRPSSLFTPGSSHSSSSEYGAAFTTPESAVMPKVGSSSGEDSPPPMSHISGSPHLLSASAAVLAIPALAKAREFRYLRWQYRCTAGSFSCLGSLDSVESSPEASQGLRSPESSAPSAPPSGHPKCLSRQEVLEEHWGYGCSSRNDSDSDVSPASGCTSCSGTKWSPAATASSPALTTSLDFDTLQLDTGVSYGELKFETHGLLLDSPQSTASVKSLCPMPAAMPTPHAQLSPASPQASCHTSTGTANILRSTNSAAAAATAGTTAVKGGLIPSSVKVTRPSPRAAAPTITATARHSCRATSSPSTAEARGGSVQSGRAAAPRPTLSTSSAAGEPVQRGALHHQSTTATAVPAALQPAPLAASFTSMSAGRKKAANKRLRSTPVPAAAGVTTRGQAAAKHKTTPTSGVVAESIRPRQARSLKSEAPTRRQPQRAAKPQWR